MSEKITNREILEQIAKEVMKLTEPNMIEAFVSMYLYTMLLD